MRVCDMGWMAAVMCVTAQLVRTHKRILATVDVSTSKRSACAAGPWVT